jgi:1-aminocyclopropane-1-carboxylate deaminase/D-cysteine desulfhydrase-like pyridoxal-dependent ACC family enzyme
MDRLSFLLPKTLKKRGLMQQAQASLITHKTSVWLKEKLPHLESQVKTRSFKDGTLTIACSHPIALQECQGLCEELRTFLRQECDLNLQDIRIIRD